MHKYLVSNDGYRAGANADFMLRRRLAGWGWRRHSRCGFSCSSWFSSSLHIEQHLFTLQEREVILSSQSESLIGDGTVFKSQLHDCWTRVKFITIIKEMSQDKSWQVVSAVQQHPQRRCLQTQTAEMCFHIRSTHILSVCLFNYWSLLKFIDFQEAITQNV